MSFMCGLEEKIHKGISWFIQINEYNQGKITSSNNDIRWVDSAKGKEEDGLYGRKNGWIKDG